MNTSEISLATCPLPDATPIGGDKSHSEAHRIMAIFLKSGGDHYLIQSSLKGKELEDYTDQFVEDIRNNSLDFTRFFPPHKIETGREMFRRFANEYETKAERKKKQDALDQKEIDRLEAEIAVHEMERKQLSIQMARADEKIAKANAILIEERRLRPIRLAQSLQAIFTKINLSNEQAEGIFSKYLNNGDFTVEENEQGIPFLKINSMNTVIRFFFDHPNMEIKSLDFRHFGNIESARVQEIANFLQDPATECIKAIAFKEVTMPDVEASKRILGNLLAFRQQQFGKFIVQCK